MGQGTWQIRAAPSESSLASPGHTFTPADLAVIPFFENLLRESSGDDDLGVRWATVTADPLKYSPLPNPAAWRKNRGLGDVPKFGVLPSGNVWLTDAAGKTISRATFYAQYLPLLGAVVDARRKAGLVDWIVLARDRDSSYLFYLNLSEN